MPRIIPSYPNPLPSMRTGSRWADGIAGRLLDRTRTLVPILLSVAFCASSGLAGPAFVQVGSFRDEAHADRLLHSMTAAGFGAAIERSGELRRVVVGPFDDKDGASDALRQLLSKGFEGFVRLDPVNLSAAPPLPTPSPQPPSEVAEVAPVAASSGAKPSGGFSDLDSYFFLQVGAFGPSEAAQQMVERLAEIGYSAINVPGKDWNRVIVGPFRTREQALAESAELAAKGFDSFVRRGAPPLSHGPSGKSLANISQALQPTPAPELFRFRPKTRLPPKARSLSPDRVPDIDQSAAWPGQLPWTSSPGPPGAVPKPPDLKTEQALAVAAPPIIKAPSARNTPGQRLRIEVLEGSGATNDIVHSRARSPAVSVLDVDGSPLSDATVTYQAPDRGASGFFANGSRSVTMMTGQDGVARAIGFQPNDVPGQFEIRVTVSHEGAQATERIVQTNVREAGRPRATVKILGSVGAGVALWSLVRYFRRGDTQPSNPTAAVVGTASIGQPTAVEP